MLQYAENLKRTLLFVDSYLFKHKKSCGWLNRILAGVPNVVEMQSLTARIDTLSPKRKSSLAVHCATHEAFRWQSIVVGSLDWIICSIGSTVFSAIRPYRICCIPLCTSGVWPGFFAVSDQLCSHLDGRTRSIGYLHAHLCNATARSVPYIKLYSQ
jgi:hypothetical protein